LPEEKEAGQTRNCVLDTPTEAATQRSIKTAKFMTGRCPSHHTTTFYDSRNYYYN